MGSSISESYTIYLPQIGIDGDFAQFLDPLDDRLLVSSIQSHDQDVALKLVADEEQFGHEIHGNAAQLSQISQAQVLRNAQMARIHGDGGPGKVEVGDGEGKMMMISEFR